MDAISLALYGAQSACEHRPRIPCVSFGFKVAQGLAPPEDGSPGLRGRLRISVFGWHLARLQSLNHMCPGGKAPGYISG